MEMASAHGLALKLVEMNRLDRINRNDVCEIISEEDKIIKSWFIGSNQPRFFKSEFFNLTRRTLLYILSQSSLKEVKKKELLKGVSIYFDTFSAVLKNNSDIRRPLIEAIVDPWKNKCFSWDELFQKKISIKDPKVQQYFSSEPEEIVLARTHFLSREGKDEMSMILAKNSFLFHSRIASNLTLSQFKKSTYQTMSSDAKRKGLASMDWYLHNLQRKKSLAAIYNELQQLACHEGVLLAIRLKLTRRMSFACTIVDIFLMRELVQASKYCCTKKIFSLWCILHKEQKTPIDVISEKIRKMMALYAPSSAHFYLFVDALWEQFGIQLVNVYVELYIRGLTSDLNHLEAARHGNVHDDVIYLESHIASTFYKLSTLFIDFHDRAARECMFSAFSLKPTKDRLCILQSLTLSILSTEKSDSSLNHNILSVLECKCAIKCAGLCKGVKEHSLEHPILTKGIPNVPYSVVKDLVSVLESVRCFRFQYNIFDWHNNATELGDYLRDFTESKNWESDTDCASEGSIKADEDNEVVDEPLLEPPKVSSLQLSAKRKSESSDLKEIFSLDVGANIEVENVELANKKMKISERNEGTAVSSLDIFKTQPKPPQNFISNLGMEDAIENVIRMTLDNNRQKSNGSFERCRIFDNASVTHVSDRTEKLNPVSAYKPVSESHASQYSLTYVKNNNLTSNVKRVESLSSFKTENAMKYPYFPPMPSTLSQVLSSPKNLESVISSTLNVHRMQSVLPEQSSKQVAQSTFASKTVPCLNPSKSIPTSTVVPEKRTMYQQEALNLDCKSSVYERMRNISATVSQSSQYITSETTMQVVRKSNTVSKDYSKSQFLSGLSAMSPSTSTAPINLVQPKQLSAVQTSQYPSVSHDPAVSSAYKIDSRYQIEDSDTLNKSIFKRMNQSISGFQDNNQLVQCDRSSVIKHTTHHVKEKNSQISQSEVELPNQLAVSVNSDAAEQIRSVPKKDVANLPPFTVNVTDRSISNSSLAVAANLVIARKAQQPVEVSSLPVSSSMIPGKNSETITIPGILASPSVIVSPWEAQHKVHGEVMYKKNAHAVAASSVQKRIYKHQLPYGKPVLIKSELKPHVQNVPNDKNNNNQVFKAIPTPSHASTYRAVHPPNQSHNTNTSQHLTVVSRPQQAVSHATASQPWYSEPYPKPQSSKNILPASSGSTSMVKDSSSIKLFEPVQNDPNSFMLYPKKINPVKNQSLSVPKVTSALSALLHNSVPSSAESNSHNLNTHSSVNVPTSSVASSSLLGDYDYSSPLLSNNIKTYSTVQMPAKSDLLNSSIQLTNRLKLSAEMSQGRPNRHMDYTVSNSANVSHLYTQGPSKEFPNRCCSPSELKPCQNCSYPPANNLTLSANEKNLDDHPLQTVLSNQEMILEMKNEPMSDINSGLLASENLCVKPLSGIVPEQNSLFQKESFHDDLPQTAKSFINPEVKNLDEIEANAINACLDLFNSDNDLKTMVQGYATLDQIDANYLPYMPPAGQEENFMTADLCNNIEDNGICETQVQNTVVLNKVGELNNYDAHCKSSQMQGNKVSKGKSFNSTFEFIELSKSAHKPPKSHESFPEKVMPKTSNELSFADIAEMIKDSIGNCPGELESFETCLEENQNDILPLETNDPNDILLPETIGQNDILPIELNNQNDIPIPKMKKLKPVTSVKTATAVSCPYCQKNYSSTANLRRHIANVHADLPQGIPEMMVKSRHNRKPSVADTHDVTIKVKDENSESAISPNESSNSVHRVLLPKARPVSDNLDCPPKGKLKGSIKNNPKINCRFCGKLLTLLYMKTHIHRKHKDLANIENFSVDFHNSDNNQNVVSAIDPVNVPPVSPLLEQDIDSSTCLSVSDALKRNNSYSVDETHQNVKNEPKFSDETDVKFNFDVIEFPNGTNVSISKTDVSSAIEKTHIENLADFEEKKFIPENKNNGTGPNCYCPLCDKCYTSVGYLRRHLENFHNFKTVKGTKKNKMPSGKIVVKSESEENQQASCTQPQKVADRNVKSLNPAMKETSPFTSKQEAGIEKLSSSAASITSTAKEKCRSLSISNVNRSLLKSVLQSNFVRDYRESQTSAVLNNSLQDKQTDICDTSRTSESNLKPCNEQFSIFNESSLENFQSSKDTECKSDDDPSKLVPFENLSEIQSIVVSEKCSLKSSTNVHSNSVMSENLQSSPLNSELPESSVNSETAYPTADLQNSSSQCCESSLKWDSSANSDVKDSYSADSENVSIESENSAISDTSVNSDIKDPNSIVSLISDAQYFGIPPIPESNINTDIKYPIVTDTENSSVQSSEISPISQIISNVSRCHFGGTSNNDNEKAFEDNSLKLAIPENRDELVCKTKKVSEDNPLKLLMPKNDDVSASNDNHVCQSDESNVESNPYPIKSDIKIEPDIKNDQEGINYEVGLMKSQDSACNEPCSSNDDLVELYSDQSVNNSLGHEINHNQNISTEMEGKSHESDVSYRKILDETSKECKSCEGVLSDKSSEFENTCVSSDESDVKCRLCHQNLKSMEILSKHLKEVHDGTSEVCESFGKDCDKSYEFENTSESSDKSDVRCRLCHQKLGTMEILAKHLKELHDIPVLKKHVSQPPSPKMELHDIPVLKKHVSQPPSPKKLVSPQKLSPPKLKLGTNESDSESMSDFDIQKVEICSKEIPPTLSEQSVQNKEQVLTKLSADLKPAFKEVGSTKRDIEMHNACVLPDDISSFFKGKNNNEHLTFSRSMRKKSTSLPNLKIVFDQNSASPIEFEISCNKSLGENNCFNGKSVDKAKTCKISSDSSKILFHQITESHNDCEISSNKSSSVKNVIEMSAVDSTSVSLDNAPNNAKICESSSHSSKIVAHQITESSVDCEMSNSKCSDEEKDVIKTSAVDNTSLSCNDAPDNDEICKNSFDSSKIVPHKVITNPVKCEMSGNKSSAEKNDSTEIPSVDNTSLGSDNGPDNSEICKNLSDSSKNMFHKVSAVPGECEMSNTKSPGEKNDFIETSSVDNMSLSSDNSEICKNSCDSSSSSSQSISVPWNKITINSSFLLPNPVSSSVPRISHKRTILRSKFSGRKLIIQRLKTYKKQKKKKSKSRHLTCHKKFKMKKTYKPIILTLREATDVEKFLETHKQPQVKLIRLKENETKTLKQESDHIPIICDKINMKEAVVKLERVHIPSNTSRTHIRGDLFVPKLLSQKTLINTEPVKINKIVDCTNTYYGDASNMGGSAGASKTDNPLVENVEMYDVDSNSSSDSIQFLGETVRKRRGRVRRIKTDFCSTPSTKKCFVVLNRISV